MRGARAPGLDQPLVQGPVAQARVPPRRVPIRRPAETPALAGEEPDREPQDGEGEDDRHGAGLTPRASRAAPR